MNVFKFAVTGHRKISYPDVCGRAIRKLMKDIIEKLKQKETEISLILLSPLAEGADRIVAHEWLRFDNVILDCPLPLEIDDYLTDFKSDVLKDEFNVLLSCCRNIEIMGKQSSRSASYKAVGHYVVDHCDVLLAVWNGLPPDNEAGTAAIVEYARSISKPLYWIHSEQPEKITGERVEEIFGEK